MLPEFMLPELNLTETAVTVVNAWISAPCFLLSISERRCKVMSNKIYNACIYARLSRDDGDKLESDSITNQKALIRDFLSKHPEIHVVSEKTDDG